MAFFGSRISDHMSRTKEGFLVCHDVPIARTGWLEYTPAELGLDDPRPIVRVYRSPESLFNKATMSSFEGKSVTDQHPPEDVTAANYATYERGHIQEVRKGSPLKSGEIPLIANLVIKDPDLIARVEPKDGVREVSIGYKHKIVPFGKNYAAIGLEGNHTAVVPNGRAGSEVSIRDAAPTILKSTRSNTPMATNKNSLFGRMLKAFAVDAEPEEVAAAAKFGESKDEESSETEAEKTLNPLDERFKSIEDSIKQLRDCFEADKKARDEAAAPKPKEEETESEDEDLITPEEEEEAVAEDAEAEGEVIEPSERPESPITGSDKATVASLRALKPLVAKSGDKSMIDAYNTTLRALKGGKKSGQDGYKALSQAIAVKSADAEALMVDAKAKELSDYRAMLEAAGEKAVAGYRR